MRSKYLIEFMQLCLEHLLVRKHSLIFGDHCGRKRAAEGVFYNILIPAGTEEKSEGMESS
jgi:hypothetical protein